VVYVDVATPMLGADGEPRPELFIVDGLHMSAEGYALWTTVLKPVLLARAGPGAGS
jgi:lysophospholipase L1-like esterase